MNSSRRKLLQCAGVAGAAAAGAVSLRAAEKDPVQELLSVFSKRQTVRRYKSDPVPKGHIEQILDAARWAPTCMNQQPWKFLVITDKARIQAMKQQCIDRNTKAFEQYAAKNKELTPEQLDERRKASLRFTEGYFSAPCYVVVLVDSESACSGYALRHDGPMAVAYLMAAARAFGYGTAYLTDGIPDSVTREVLNIPQRYTRICITPIGIPDGWPRKQEKRKLQEMVAWETLEGHPELERLPYNPSA